MFGNSSGEFLDPPNGKRVFTLKQAEIRVFNRKAYNLWTDLSLILEAAKELSVEDVRSWQAVECARNIVNICHTDDETTWDAAIAVAQEFLSVKNNDAQHQVMATGHCHIDTAWLWPYSETRRKVARSWSTQCTIGDDFSSHVFTASQAQQFEWMYQNYPGLFKRIQEKVKKGQFVPIGATWIEMDCNIPSGEAFARQFLVGQKFFQRAFDLTCKVFWLPDTFGYSSQLPQIIKQSECDFFLTQKLSWNNINKFPHNTFYWQGLDGTQVLSHFPPADTYVSEANVHDLIQGTKNFKTKDKSNRSMMLFGYGDGGGGPDPHHLARLTRLTDVAGIPKVAVGHPEDFFKAVVKDESERMKKIAAASPNLSKLAKPATSETDIPKWVGELYFELHRGTYTTHARNKNGNRKGEFLLQAVELLSVMASKSYDANAHVSSQVVIAALWKLLLLNQFHDVLPGTSIGLVYQDSDQHYREIQEAGSSLAQSFLSSIVGKGNNVVAFNPLSWARTVLIELPSATSSAASADPSSPRGEGRSLALVQVPGMGISEAIVTDVSIPGIAPVHVTEDSGIFKLESANVCAKIDKHGRISSLVHKPTGRESIVPGTLGNHFVLFEDVPFFWDAWDVEIYHTDKPVAIIGYEQEGNARLVESGPLRVSIEFTLAISKDSKIKQRLSLDATSDTITATTEVDWHENRKFLKVEFPLNVHANQTWYSTQFGCQARPNHKNTTWDMAKFEVCAHHWADLNEFGFGVAILNDCKYGYSCDENVMRLSLLRSSKQPDLNADMGVQKFKYGILPHAGSHADAQLARRGLEFNCPVSLVTAAGETSVASLFEAVSSAPPMAPPTLILETVKAPEPEPINSKFAKGNWIILRLWESSGARGIATFKTTLEIAEIVHVNILENPISDSTKKFVNQAGFFTVPYNPFEVITLAVLVK